MNYNPFSLVNKLILVTGASSGIGQQCAISCSKIGAKVILLGRNKKKLEETFSLMQNNADHEYFRIDLTDYKAVNILILEIYNKHGRIDGVINSAGISTTLPLKMSNPEKLNEYLNTNVIAAINLSRLVTQKKYFSKNGGSIIFISSVMGQVGEAGKTLYGITKGALISGSKSMAIELASRKIRVNTVSPGVVDTPMSQNAVYSNSEEALNHIQSLHPLGLGKVEDISASCIFLLSDAARWITGTNLVIDGGYTAR